jgi:trigger factor
MQKLQSQMAVRDKVLEAAADLVPVTPPQTLVDSETRRRIEDLAHRLSHQGANLDQYLEATGQDPQAFVDEVKVGAARAVLADLALRAVVSAEDITATDDEIDREVVRLAERADQKPEKVRRELERSGALETVRSDVTRGKALEFLVEHATVVDEDGNEIDLDLEDEASTAADEEQQDEQDEHEEAHEEHEQEDEETSNA